MRFWIPLIHTFIFELQRKCSIPFHRSHLPEWKVMEKWVILKCGSTNHLYALKQRLCSISLSLLLGSPPLHIQITQGKRSLIVWTFPQLYRRTDVPTGPGSTDPCNPHPCRSSSSRASRRDWLTYHHSSGLPSTHTHKSTSERRAQNMSGPEHPGERMLPEWNGSGPNKNRICARPEPGAFQIRSALCFNA